MFNKIKLSALAIAVASMAGCANTRIPTDSEAESPTRTEMTNKYDTDWSESIPAITRVDRRDMLVINQPNKIPESILNKHIEIKFGEEKSVKHLVPVFKQIGVGLVIPDAELRDKPIVLVEYSGKVGDFIAAIGAAYGLSFEYLDGGFIIARSKANFILSIPQEEDVAKEIESALTSMGAEQIKTSVMGGSISYIASTQDQNRIKEYLQRLSVNTALMSMQVAIVTVSIDRERNIGFDWSKLSAKVGNLKMGQMSENGGSSGDGSTGNGTDGGTGTGPGTGTGTTEPKLEWPSGVNSKDTQAYLGLASQAASVVFGKGNLDINATINFLSTYGKTETSQNVLMKTLAGKKVTLKSGQKIPYVKEIGTSSASNNLSGNSLENNSVEFDDLEVGLNLQLTPYYEANSSIVAIEMNLKLDALISFLEVKAGNQVGSVSRPSTQNQKFQNYLMLPAGNTAIVGGIYYDQIEDDRSNFAPLDKYDLANKNYKIQRNALFIIIRPTVTVFGNFENKVIQKNEVSQ